MQTLLATPPMILIPLATLVLLVATAITLIAVREGREVSFWPPRIGPRPPKETTPALATSGPVSAQSWASPADQAKRIAGSPAKGDAAQLGDSPPSVPAYAAPCVHSVRLAHDPLALLYVLSGSRHGDCIVLTEEGRSLTMGRGVDVDIGFPNDVAFSRSHCRIVLEPTSRSVQRCFRIVLMDQGSGNGTFVNGKPIDRLELAHGDLIEIGGTRMSFWRTSRPPAQQMEGG